MKFEVTSREIFAPSPAPGIGIMGAGSYYTSLEKCRLVSSHGHTTRSDTRDIAFLRFSEDNGKTWSKSIEWPTKFDSPNGTGRRHPRGGFVDPDNGFYINVWTEGVLPNDNPIEGMRHWKLHYSVSLDGGKTDKINEQIICAGEEFDQKHFMPGVINGKNCVMIGDLGERPLKRSDGAILIPVQSSRIGPDGDYFNPGNCLTFLDSLLLIGTWKDDYRISWTTSERVLGDFEKTTRGFFEPTIAELADGSILMVMRGSNQRNPVLPGHKWVSKSADGGMTWSAPVPWAYQDGEKFFSPSSCSQLIPYSDGRLFWGGNICNENSEANSPRYPFVIGEVDLDSGKIIRDSVTVIDDKKEDDSPFLTLSNFLFREDRETKDLLLHMSRMFAQDFRENNQPDWTCDALLYRIKTS